MESIVDFVLAHGHVDMVSQVMLSACNKSLYEAVNRALPPRLTTTEGVCVKFPKERPCTEHNSISKTAAKKQYVLKENDMKYINFSEVYYKKYRRYITIYRLRDVVAYALTKHKVRRVQDIPRKVRKSRVDVRLEALKAAAQKGGMSATDCEDLAYHGVFEKFVRNGTGGIRRVGAHFAQWKDFCDWIDASTKDGVQEKTRSYIQGMRAQYFSWCVPDVTTGRAQIQADIARFGEMNSRTSDLVAALHRLGISHSDEDISTEICNAYITGDRDDLDNICTITREMQFFQKHTLYSYMMDCAVDKYYEDASRHILEVYGWVYRSLYEELIAGLVDKQSISLECQEEALNEWLHREDPNPNLHIGLMPESLMAKFPRLFPAA